jgi:type 1 glutamine amidotransferase
MFHRILALTLLAVALCTSAPLAGADDAQPAPVPGQAPKGRVIIDGAVASKADPPSYAISYVADDAVAGTPLRAVLKCAVKVDKMVKNAKTGQEEKKSVTEHVLKTVPITLKKQGEAAVSLADAVKGAGVELFLAGSGEKPEPISNSLLLRPVKEGWTLPEAPDLPKVEQALPEKAPAAPAKPRKVLAFTYATGFYHSSIPVCARATQMLGDRTGAWKTVISNDKFMFEPETLAQFDAVMMCSTTGSLFGADKAANERLRKSFLDFVSGGKGLAGSHAATDCSYDWKEYGQMIGGFFAGHPFGRIRVKNEDPKSPINAAFKGEDFDFQDEMYVFRDPYSREKLRILLSIDLAKSPMKDDPKKPGFKMGENREDHDYAISWVREHGQGRVFYCSFGHDHRVFQTPSIMQHFLAGIQYALGDLKADATPSAKR